MNIPFGVSSMVAPLQHVLVQQPTAAFGEAFNDPAGGYLRPVDLEVARKEHELFVEALGGLGPTIHQLEADSPYPDQIYTYDPALVTEEGAVLLRSGKPGRRGEEDILGAWFESNGVPILGRIAGPGTVDGGDVMWLRPDAMCVGRSLRTNQAGIEQLAELVPDGFHVFDVPYDEGPAACLHLMSSVSMVTADLAIVERRRLPAGLHSLLADLEVTLIDVPSEEVDTLATNVLAVRPGVVMVVEGNPMTRRSLEAAGVEVHAFAGEEIAINGTGGPTCLTRPVLRA
ncbi:MAG: amidinotransferase [bacterium]|nr:amidinotransferase [bacterium]